MPTPPRVPLVNWKSHCLKTCRNILANKLMVLMTVGRLPVIGKPFSKEGVQIGNPKTLVRGRLKEQAFKPALDAMACCKIIFTAPIRWLCSHQVLHTHNFCRFRIFFFLVVFNGQRQQLLPLNRSHPSRSQQRTIFNVFVFSNAKTSKPHVHVSINGFQ